MGHFVRKSEHEGYFVGRTIVTFAKLCDDKKRINKTTYEWTLADTSTYFENGKFYVFVLFYFISYVQKRIAYINAYME